MSWGSIELEPEVRDWLERLPTTQFATAAFHLDLLADEGHCSVSRMPGSSMASCGSCASIWTGTPSASPTGSPRAGGSSYWQSSIRRGCVRPGRSGGPGALWPAVVPRHTPSRRS